MVAAAKSPQDQIRLKFADGIRGLAALWVVLFHASEGGHIEHLKAALPTLLSRIIFDLGHFGVPAFFVLSGFVMMFMANRTHFDWRGTRGFLVRRMVRLGPPYYLSIVIVLIFLALKHYMSGAPLPSIDWQVMLGHMTYTQPLLAKPWLNSVYWTLSVEVQFYVVFAMIMLATDRWSAQDRRASIRARWITVSALAGLPWAFGLITHPLYSGSFFPFWTSFAAGALACLSWCHGGKIRVVFWAYLSLLAAAAIAQSSGFIATSVLTATGLALAGKLGRMDVWLRWQWCQFLGLISYSLYLVHNPLTGAGFNALRRIFPATALGEMTNLVVVVVICVAAAFALYLTVERVSIRWSRKFGQQTGQAPPVVRPTLAAPEP